MPKEILEDLLKEYEQKKIRAELDLEKRKEKLYNDIPELGNIESELNNLAISTAKNILLNNKNSIENFKNKIKELNTKKLEILKKNNIDIDYLKPNYECKLCNDTGYITKNNYKSEMCSCLKQKLLNIAFNNSNMSNLDKENFATFNENIFSNEINIEKYKYNISPRQNIKNIKNKCIKFIENFDNTKTKNLLFTGNTGLR